MRSIAWVVCLGALGVLRGAKAKDMAAYIAVGANNYEFVDNFAAPRLGTLHHLFQNLTACEVLIQVMGSSVNPADRYNDAYRIPKVIGSDISGIIIDMQPNCTSRLQVGDAIWGDIGANALLLNGTKTKELGGYGQYAVALESQISHMPKNLNFTEAGVLPKVSLTSYKALVWYGGAPWARSTTILILGGSGGTGSSGIQLAKAFGADTIITTTSGANAEYCKSLGASRIIDYHKENWWEVLIPGSVDVIYDCVGQSGTADRALSLLPSGGYFVTIAGQLSQNPKEGVSQAFFINSDTNIINFNQLDILRDMVEKNLLLPRISSVYPLDRTEEAFNVSSQGHVVGKLAIQVALNSTHHTLAVDAGMHC
ncbi:hypothetical protein AAMO2058_000831500 [Amorphochlora amoebiformis]